MRFGPPTHVLRTLALACGILAASPATPEACKVDTPPAATLLLPYFEVDLSRTDGITTMFSIGNATASATLAHVTLWTDLGVPTLNFNVYLTGWDIETLNVRDLFNGVLPRTASDGQDPTDTISPQGTLTASEVNFFNVGRNVEELLRKFKANLYLSKKPTEVCPAKWKDDGDKTLTPSARMVGKVHEALNQK